MTLDKYDEIMDKIIVTPEMKTRILTNLKKAELKPRHKAVRFRSYGKLGVVAACMAVFILGIISFLGIMHLKTAEDSSMLMSQADEITDMRTVTELSQKVGFPVEDLSYIPFAIKETSYKAYGNDLAEILYIGDTQSLCYRKSPGSKDNSGDYNVYDSEMQSEVDNIQVTWKGNNGKYYLAAWSKEGYSYSISIDNGVKKEVLENIIKRMDNKE